MVRQGFTTLPESWDARPGTPNSMNHIMLGHLMEWHYAYVAGIRQKAGSVGWRRPVIQPNPGLLESASATFQAPSGTIAVRWAKQGGGYTMQVQIPGGVDAEAVLPNGERHSLAPGESTLNW